MKNSNRILLIAIAILFGLIAIGAILFRFYFSRIAVTMPGPVIFEQVTVVPLSKNGTKNPTQDGSVKSLKPFDKIITHGAWNIKIIHGKQYSIQITASPDIQPYLLVSNENGQLNLSMKDHGGDLLNNRYLLAKITTPNFNLLHAEGAANIIFDGFDLNQVHIETAGAAHIYGKNSSIEQLFLKSAGAAEFNLLDTKIKNAHIKTAGASAIKLNMMGGDLTGKIAGISTVRYTGTVQHQNVKSFGLSSIEPIF